MEHIQWNRKFAYAVGLIAADGNLSSDGRHLEFTSKDIDLIQTFKRCLQLSNRIGSKPGSYTGKRYPRIQFGNVKFYRWLLQIGLKPRKSMDLGALAVPDGYFFDFLRGSLDGDGCIRTFQDPVYLNATRLYTTFSSGSRKHPEWIQSRVTRFCSIKGFITRGTKKVWELTYAKRDSQTLLKAIYYSPGVPCLKRKYQLARPFLNH